MSRKRKKAPVKEALLIAILNVMTAIINLIVAAIALLKD